jgi:hypothetical protein
LAGWRVRFGCGKRLRGAWVFKNTWVQVATMFENLEFGSSIEESIEQ